MTGSLANDFDCKMFNVSSEKHKQFLNLNCVIILKDPVTFNIQYQYEYDCLCF